MAAKDIPAAAKEKPMQLAEILSDLVSLRVCDPAAALALVTARPSQNPALASDDSPQSKEEQDPDLKRAKDLVELHYSVREAHKRGELAQGLFEARESVERAVK